jgi:hypothetical protein
LACLYYEDDEPGRWAQARQILLDHPEITRLSVCAAMDGRLDLARSLLRLGADPGIRDQRFDSTPLGWARYFGQEQLVALLEPLTAPEGP